MVDSLCSSDKIKSTAFSVLIRFLYLLIKSTSDGLISNSVSVTPKPYTFPDMAAKKNSYIPPPLHVSLLYNENWNCKPRFQENKNQYQESTKCGLYNNNQMNLE